VTTAQLTPMMVVLIVGTLVPGLLVLWYCICSINQMDAATPHGQRLSVVLIASGVFAMLCRTLASGHADSAEILLFCGLLVLVRYNCRRGVCPCVMMPTWVDRRKASR